MTDQGTQPTAGLVAGSESGHAKVNGSVRGKPRSIRAPRGPELTCKGWQQEAALRMLMNSLDPDVAERPDDLIVYGGTGRAARSWEAFDTILDELRCLEDDQTLLIQSGKPVAVLQTHEWAPRVLLANALVVPEWCTQDEFRRLEAAGLTMFGQMTAGSWAYIGSQGILQSTYATFDAVGQQSFGGDLAGTLTLTAGLGGMGGAQPLAVTMNNGVVICVEIDQKRIDRRLKLGYLDMQAESLEDAFEIAAEALANRRPLSIGLRGHAGEVAQTVVSKNLHVDIVTDQTAAHDPLYYVPDDLSAEEADRLRTDQPDEYLRRARQSIRRHVSAMVTLMDRGAVVFEYGNCIRAEAKLAGVERAFEFPGFVAAYIRPFFLEAKGHCRWIALSGDPNDITRLDDALAEEFAENASLRRWLTLAKTQSLFQGLPARTCMLGYGERARAGKVINDMVARGELSAPLVIGREHLDAGSVSSPYRETEGMMDGSDAIADWPVLNALVNVASGASWVSVHQGGGVGIGRSMHAGLMVVADGTELAAQKVERTLTNDPATGVIRYADAGYSGAETFARRHGLGLAAPV